MQSELSTLIVDLNFRLESYIVNYFSLGFVTLPLAMFDMRIFQ